MPSFKHLSSMKIIEIENHEYEAPLVEVIVIEVELGFSASTEDYEEVPLE